MDSQFDEHAISDKLKWSEWKRTVRYLGNHKKQAYILLVCCFLSAIVDAAVPYFSRYAFAVFVGKKTLDGLGVFCLLYVLAAVLQFFFTYYF